MCADLIGVGAAVLQKTKLTPEQQELVDAVVIFGESCFTSPIPCINY